MGCTESKSDAATATSGGAVPGGGGGAAAGAQPADSRAAKGDAATQEATRQRSDGSADTGASATLAATVGASAQPRQRQHRFSMAVTVSVDDVDTAGGLASPMSPQRGSRSDSYAISEAASPTSACSSPHQLGIPSQNTLSPRMRRDSCAAPGRASNAPPPSPSRNPPRRGRRRSQCDPLGQSVTSVGDEHSPTIVTPRGPHGAGSPRRGSDAGFAARLAGLRRLSQTGPAPVRRGSGSAPRTPRTPSDTPRGATTRNDNAVGDISDVQDIGSYMVHKFLGRGSWAVVHECVHKATGERYAVKSWDKEKLGARELERSGRREAAILRKLEKQERHAHISNVVETLESPRWFHLVVDLGAQGDLRGIIRREGPLCETRAKKYFRDLLTGVKFMHANNVVHRDIKPMNILLTADDRLLITDFGLGDFIRGGLNADERTRLTERCGTPDYVAPEVLDTQGSYDGTQADVWSCGVTLFVFLVGRTPWEARGRREKLVEIATGVWRNATNEAPLGALSQDVNALLEKLLHKDVTRRPDIASCLRAGWFKKKGAVHM